MTRPQSSAIEPGGKVAESSKKLDFTDSTVSGLSSQPNVFNSSPSNRPSRRVGEYPIEPARKKSEAAFRDPNTDDFGKSSVSCPSTDKCVRPSLAAMTTR
jgi:hypothetical protein